MIEGQERLISNAEVAFGPFRLLVSKRLLMRAGLPVEIGSKALQILTLLVARPGEVVSNREILHQVWPGGGVEDVNLRSQMNTLRKILGDDGHGSRYIINVPKQGYCFVGEATSDHPGAHASKSSGTKLDSSRELPSLPSPFLGRQEILAELVTAMSVRQLITITGAGGIGKTTLATAVAHQIKAQGESAIHFVDLSTLNHPDDLVAAIILAVGCPANGQTELKALTSFLEERRCLLVMDSCEHVIDTAAKLVARLRKDAPDVKILATSREPLRVDDEAVYPLRPLDLPDEMARSTETVLAASAAQLFVTKASSSGFSGSLSEADVRLVSTMCRRLDGNPLAIELVASRVGLYGLNETARLLDDGIMMNMMGRRDAAPRHQTLAAMVGWSYGLLSSFERKLFRRLSVFIGQFDLEAARQVAGWDMADVRSVQSAVLGLVEKSLVAVVRDRNACNFRLLDTTRAFAENLLSEDEDAEVIHDRHSAYFSTVLRAEFESSFGVGRSLLDGAADIGNIRKALTRAFSDKGGMVERAKLAAYASLLFLGHSLYLECQSWCQRALNELPTDLIGTDIELALQEALAISTVSTWGVTDQFYQSIERGLEISNQRGDLTHQTKFLAGLHVYRLCRFDSIGAISAARNLAELADTTDDVTIKVISEWSLGNAYHLDGRQDEALRHYQRGIELETPAAKGLIDLFGVEHRARATAGYARCLWTKGFPDQALKVAMHGIQNSLTGASAVTFCHAALHLTQVGIWCGGAEKFEALLEVAIEKTRSQTLLFYEALALSVKGELLLSKGDTDAALEVLKAADRIIQKHHYYMLEPQTSAALTIALTCHGRLENALEVVDLTLSHMDVGRGYYWYPELLRIKAKVLAEVSGDRTEAITLLTQSIDVSRSQAAASWELRSLIDLVLIWQASGRAADAYLALERAIRKFPEAAFSPDLQRAREIMGSLENSVDSRPGATVLSIVPRH